MLNNSYWFTLHWQRSIVTFNVINVTQSTTNVSIKIIVKWVTCDEMKNFTSATRSHLLVLLLVWVDFADFLHTNENVILQATNRGSCWRKLALNCNFIFYVCFKQKRKEIESGDVFCQIRKLISVLSVIITYGIRNYKVLPFLWWILYWSTGVMDSMRIKIH